MQYDLADSRYPYVSYIDHHCRSEGIKLYLKAEISLIKNKHLPKDFNFVEVKNADIFVNFSNFRTPSQDDTYQCEIFFAAYADNNSILVGLGKFEQHSMLLLVLW